MNALVFDTETIGVSDKRCFEIGWTIGNLDTGEIHTCVSYLVEEIFLDPVYKTAYYFEKNDPEYKRLLSEDNLKVLPIREIRQLMNDDIVKFDVKVIAAFNIAFDISALNQTYAYAKTLDSDETHESLYKSISKDNWKSNFRVVDIPMIFCYTLATDEYAKFCETRDGLTKNGNYSTTVETISRFLRGSDYTEKHIAKDDSLDEFKILKECWYIKGESTSWEEDDNKPWAILKRKFNGRRK